LPFCCASVRTSSACVFCKTFWSTKRSRTCWWFISSSEESQSAP